MHFQSWIRYHFNFIHFRFNFSFRSNFKRSSWVWSSGFLGEFGLVRSSIMVDEFGFGRIQSLLFPNLGLGSARFWLNRFEILRALCLAFKKRRRHILQTKKHDLIILSWGYFFFLMYVGLFHLWAEHHSRIWNFPPNKTYIADANR